jgi:signal transduction histidine kinase
LEHQRPWHLAIATEHAARCFERHGLLMASRPLFTETLALHRQLGAHGKVADLVAKWPFLKTATDPTGTKYSPTGSGLQSLAQAFQSLAEQQTLKALAERTAQWLADFTGATDVRILALDAEDRWILKASLAEGWPIEAMPLREAVQKDLVSETVLSLCEASNGFLLSNDATGDERFLRDPHFASMSACSLLAISVVIHSKPRALVVLENRLVRSAFQPAVVEMAQMLCGQLALAIGNIRNREALGRLVDERTADLQVAREREKTLDRTAYELTENIPIGTFALEFDRAGDPSFTFMSERWLDMLDLRRERAQANPSLALLGVHPGDREEFQRLQAEAFVAKVRFFWQGRLLVRGQTRWVTIESIPRLLALGSTVQEGVMIDITDRMEAERQGRELEASHRLELRTKLKTALTAATIAHEISQPLARIIHTADLVEMNASGTLASHPRLAKFISALSADARLTSQIIDKMKKLLQNVKTEHGRVDLAECVRNAILANSISLRSTRIDIVLAEPKGRFPIHGDSAQIAIALGNLLQNAAQVMSSQPGPLAPEILIQLRRRRREIEIRIGDSGPGIAEADIPNLLLRSTKAEGTGLGLFIVQTSMENHGGRLEIARSALGGAEFRMVFPKGNGK